MTRADERQCIFGRKTVHKTPERLPPEVAFILELFPAGTDIATVSQITWIDMVRPG